MRVITIHLDSIDSTNLYGKRIKQTLDPKIMTLISAKNQTAGRGRSSKQWHFLGRECLALTYCFTLKKTWIPYQLSLLLAHAAANLSPDIKIKWPNDLLIGGKKIGGILGEISDEWIFLGIGMNINASAYKLQAIDQPAETLKGKTKNEVMTKLTENFTATLQFYDQKGFASFQSKIEQQLIHKPHDLLKVTFPQGKEEVLFCGLGKNGELIVEKHKKKLSLYGEEISLSTSNVDE